MTISKELLKNHKLPVQIEGFPYIVSGLLLTLSSLAIWRYLRADMDDATTGCGALIAAALFGLFTVFSLWFYRVPEVHTPNEVNAVVSPANGRVLHVREVDGKRIGESKAKKISIFMSPLDVHVNRAPVNGMIEDISYVKGKFFKADLDKASEENEHNWVVMKADSGQRVGFVQIAGFVARRIVCYVDKGQRLSVGERYGMIRFGSRMEVLVPLTSEILVKEGDRTVAGETIVARFKT